MKRSPTAAAAVAIMFAGSACFGGGSSRDPSVLEVTSLAGSASVRSGQKGFEKLEKGDTVPVGAIVRLDANNTVVLARGDKSFVELRAPADATGQLVVGATAGQLTIEAGDVLVTSDTSAPISVTSQGTTASAPAGVFRFDRRLRVRVGAYSGSVDVTVERGVALPELGSLDEWLVNPRTAPVRQPYTIDAADPWDRRLLADAIEIEEAISPLATGYEARFGARTRSIEELAALARDAGRDIAFVRRALATTPSADIVMGLTYALLLEAGKQGSAPQLFADLLARRGEGASWGLIAFERGLKPRDVVNAFTCAVSLRTGEARPGEGCFELTEAPQPTPRVTRSPSSTRTGSPRPTRTSSPSPSPSPTRTPSPSPTPSPTETPCPPLEEILGTCDPSGVGAGGLNS